MGKKILLYYPPNTRSVAIETLCKAVKEAGHEMIVLTLSERGAFHEAVEKMGIQTYSHVLPRKPSWKFFIRHARFLISFCKKNKIEQVWSHLQLANIAAVIAQLFMKTKVIAFRHHAESAFYAEMGQQFGMQRNANEIRFDKLINRFAKKIVVPSSGVWVSMEKYENANMKKVMLLPYIYDFSSYHVPDPEKVRRLRAEHPAQLLLIMASRMIPSKQHQPVFEVVNQLIKEGLPIKMLVMDDGPLRPELEKFIEENNLQQHIILTGFREDFVNYMAAADLLIHPSVTEASNNVVKEMGLLEKAVAVCARVGDFSDYIEEGRNGYMIETTDLKNAITRVIRDAVANPDKLKQLGRELRNDVISRFSDSPANRQRFLDLLKTS